MREGLMFVPRYIRLDLSSSDILQCTVGHLDKMTQPNILTISKFHCNPKADKLRKTLF